MPLPTASGGAAAGRPYASQPAQGLPPRWNRPEKTVPPTIITAPLSKYKGPRENFPIRRIFLPGIGNPVKKWEGAAWKNGN